MKPKTPRSLKSRALQLLAQREQSRVELRRKLLFHARAGDAADRIGRAAKDAAHGWSTAERAADSWNVASDGAGGGDDEDQVSGASPVSDVDDTGDVGKTVGVTGDTGDTGVTGMAGVTGVTGMAGVTGDGSNRSDVARADDPADFREAPDAVVAVATADGPDAASAATAVATADAGHAPYAADVRGSRSRKRADPLDSADPGPAANADADADAATRVDEVLAWLDAHRFLSDARFAESRVNARAGRYGNLRIRQELKQHGVALDADAARALSDSEGSRAWAVWERRFGAAPRTSAETGRHARFLTGRGFSPDTVRQVLRRARAMPTGVDTGRVDDLTALDATTGREECD